MSSCLHSLRPSCVAAFGFRPRLRADDVIAIMTRAIYLADIYGLPLFIASQDVATAFDSMDHQILAEAMIARGLEPPAVGSLLRELSGLRACISIAGAGSCHPFDFQRGGKQGGTETPVEFNINEIHVKVKE